VEPQVPVPYHPREKEPYFYPPTLALTRASEEIGLRARDDRFLATVASESNFPDATVQGGGSDTLLEDRKVRVVHTP
jgi:hypothetical protein